ncbi:MAG TPA: enoyl-CoA hydratase family protein [Microthrixaceae bacterium]|nr:enoyl-CoA hydratase family protein [Microthrixaceae bacterium]
MTSTQQPDELVHLNTSGGVATITLDSPSNRNALSAQLVSELMSHLSNSSQNDSVRAVVLTHTGSTFCAGADLAESAREGGPSKGTQRLVDLLRSILELPKPVVATVDGNVRAGGLGLIGACDIVMASEGSSFAFTEVRLGLAPAIISLTLLPRLDQRAAGRYFLTGERFDSAVAERIGLITESSGDVVAATDSILESLLLGSPQGLAASKKLNTASLLADFDRDAVALAAESARLFSSDDAQEGIASFLEKRPPRWAEVSE